MIREYIFQQALQNAKILCQAIKKKKKKSRVEKRKFKNISSTIRCTNILGTLICFSVSILIMQSLFRRRLNFIKLFMRFLDVNCYHLYWILFFYKAVSYCPNMLYQQGLIDSHQNEDDNNNSQRIMIATFFSTMTQAWTSSNINATVEGRYWASKADYCHETLSKAILTKEERLLSLSLLESNTKIPSTVRQLGQCSNQKMIFERKISL